MAPGIAPTVVDHHVFCFRVRIREKIKKDSDDAQSRRERIHAKLKVRWCRATSSATPNQKALHEAGCGPKEWAILVRRIFTSARPYH